MLLTRRKKSNWRNGGNNPINSKNMDLDIRAIYIHGGMEHNMAGYAKYYLCGSIIILGSSEFTRKIDHNRKDFFGHW